MRLLVGVPVALLAGFGVGVAFFRGPTPLTAVAMAALRDREHSTDPARWPDTPAATDAKAQRLMAAALRRGDRLERDNELYLAIEAFTAADFRRMISDLGALKAMGEKLGDIDYETSRNLASRLIGRWLAVDPNTVMTWAGRVIELIPASAPARDLILDALAAKRPAELLALVVGYKTAPDREEIISRALRELAAHEPSKARAWLAGCTDPADRRAAEKAIRMGTVEADPLRAIELAGAVESRQEAGEIIEAALPAALKMGPGTLRQLATTPMPSWMLAYVLGAFAEHDPELAVDLALKSGSSGLGGFFGLQRAFSELARKDHREAIARIDGLAGPDLAAAVSAIGGAWAGHEPDAALDWLVQRPTSERANPTNSADGTSDALLMAFSNWARSSRNDARAWADALPPGATRDAVQTQFARTLAASGDAAGATQVLAGLGRAADPKALKDIASAWAQRDPLAAADWAIAQPPGPAQTGALAGIVGTWANDDPRGVEDWLAQFPPGAARDRSIGAFLTRGNAGIMESDAQNAEFEAWFELIDDPWRRARVARAGFWQRRRRDPAGASAWLSSLANVDPEVIRSTLRDNPY